MVYKSLKRIQNPVGFKPSGTKEELEPKSGQPVRFLQNAQMGRGETETLLPQMNWLAICPDTKHPVLAAMTATAAPAACITGRRKRMPSMWTYGCVPTVGDVTVANKLQEAVVDLCLQRRSDNLWGRYGFRAVNAEIVRWAEEFETEHAGTDWGDAFQPSTVLHGKGKSK